MKKIIFFTLSLICVLFVTSCSNDAKDSYDDATISVSEETIGYGKGGGSETFTVTVNQKNNFIAQWENLVDWAEVSTNDNEVTVTVKPNQTTNPRTAKILVFTQNGGLKRYVDISQTATDLIFEAMPDKVQFTRLGGEKEVRITTNDANWSVEGGADWFKIEESRLLGRIRLTATENKLDNERTAVITIKSGPQEKKIEVIQKGLAELILPCQNFGAFLSEVVEFEANRGHIYKYTPKGSGVVERHEFMTNSYLMPTILTGYALGAYSGAVVMNSIPEENPEEIEKFHRNYSALLVDNGYEKRTNVEYRKPTEDKKVDIAATIFADGVLFDLYYNQMIPMPTFDKFPYGFMEWGTNQAEVDVYEASVGGTNVAFPEGAGFRLKYLAVDNDPDVYHRIYSFYGKDYNRMHQIEIGIKDYSKMIYIGNGKPNETEEFLALLKKENFKYLYRNDNSTMMMYIRPSPQGGSWVTACAIRVWTEENRSSINLWDEEYTPPAGVSSLSYIEKFQTRIEEKMKRADEASRNRARYILR